VRDAKTAESLVGPLVIIGGTPQSALTDDEGHYFILNVPAVKKGCKIFISRPTYKMEQMIWFQQYFPSNALILCCRRKGPLWRPNGNARNR
jgi:hypothetical protein